jgi:hypothetical protein
MDDEPTYIHLGLIDQERYPLHKVGPRCENCGKLLHGAAYKKANRLVCERCVTEV